ncbi:LexA family transcriptional regulator [Desulfonatronum thiosulfatophilum]|uniref:LexA family transcriptional regulator n=1 Tax=Desulfonatronum thiosulfatophilum TaxID=617002 RepID=UPI0013795375|nr:S24 family peptidase [Desulfonatronum thiosulfatophilum]
MSGEKRPHHKKFEQILERLFYAVDAANDSELARALDKTPQAIGAARDRDNVPSKWITTISERWGYSADWLLHGTGPMMREGQDIPVTRLAVETKGLKCEEPLQTYGRGVRLGSVDLVHIPKVKARLCAGSGSMETSDDIDGYYAFRSDWIHRKGQPGRMVLMDVTGDSMEPELRDGDTVLIDQSKTEILPGKVYAVGIEDAVMIKAVDVEPGQIILRSFNRDYREIAVKPGQMNGVRIVGRVVWSCREFG